MKFELTYHIQGKGTFDKQFDHYPTDEELYFLIERTDIQKATLWKKTTDEWFKVLDLI